jgi:succinate dehydrogenase flavin-adding protein (antitoxin of CptAB toxin-antitoxin module)
MRELDAVLQSFLSAAGASLDATEIAQLEKILDLPDPELLAYFTGRSAPRDPETAALVERIRASHRPAS